MTARFELTHAAELDLIEIGIYTRARWGVAQCRRYLKQLDECFHAVAKQPELGRPAEIDGYLRTRSGQHVVFYDVASDGSVLVVRVLHRHMLPARHLR
jgi:toxin ParE1/3/4